MNQFVCTFERIPFFLPPTAFSKGRDIGEGKESKIQKMERSKRGAKMLKLRRNKVGKGTN